MKEVWCRTGKENAFTVSWTESQRSFGSSGIPYFFQASFVSTWLQRNRKKLAANSLEDQASLQLAGYTGWIQEGVQSDMSCRFSLMAKCPSTSLWLWRQGTWRLQASTPPIYLMWHAAEGVFFWAEFNPKPSPHCVSRQDYGMVVGNNGRFG